METSTYYLQILGKLMIAMSAILTVVAFCGIAVVASAFVSVRKSTIPEQLHDAYYVIWSPIPDLGCYLICLMAAVILGCAGFSQSQTQGPVRAFPEKTVQ